MNDIGVKGYSAKEAAEKIGISVKELLRWQRFGIVRPKNVWRGKRKLRKYFECDIRNASVIRLFMDRGYSFEKAMIRLEELS